MKKIKIFEEFKICIHSYPKKWDVVKKYKDGYLLERKCKKCGKKQKWQADLDDVE